MEFTLKQEDLNFVADHNTDLWGDLRDSKIFLTGGTGFYGVWLVQTFCSINEKFELNAQLTVLSRNPFEFKKRFPSIADRRDVVFVPGDIRNFDFPQGTFTHCIHAATAASATMNIEDPVTMFSTVVEGTKRALEFSKFAGVRKFLLASSGAVYGPQPSALTHLSEEYNGSPDPLAINAAYGESKRSAECLAAAYNRMYGLEVKIARGFAFVGPYLPLDGTYAIGNFFADGIAGRTIKVSGDGTPFRSYLYAADLALWLWTILIRGKPMRAYNVGSDVAISIEDLANKIAILCNVKVQIAIKRLSSSLPTRYVPDINRASEELGLKVFTGLDDAVSRTINWYRKGVK
jgi:nucleoside-diphosphate-sugar epimerase